MAKKCKKSNYSKNEDSGSLYFIQDIKPEENVQDVPNFVSEEIQKVLESKDFSTSLDNSLNQDQYLKNVNELISQIEERLEKNNNIEDDDKEKILDKVKSKLLENTPPSDLEKSISAVIKGTDLISEEEVQKIRYKDMISDVFGTTNPAIDYLRQTKFQDEMMTLSIINPETGEIIDNDYTFNSNIIDYQEKQYQIVRNFLIENYFSDERINDKLFPKILYIESEVNDELKRKSTGYYNVFTAMYNIIAKLKHDGTFLNNIEKGWNSELDGVTSKERDLYRAVSAFVNLDYFDTILKTSLDKFIDIKNQVNPIIQVEDDFGFSNYEYKYSLSIGNSNAIKTWGDENPDAVKTMSKFSQFLIERIPLYDYFGKHEEFGKLSVKDFVGTFIKFQMLIYEMQL